jgi:hypothetical protein
VFDDATGQDGRREAVALWVEEARDWFAWAKVWFNRPQPRSLRGFRPRRVQPVAPLWLAEYCADSWLRENEAPIFAEACDLHREIATFLAGRPLNQQATVTREAEEGDDTRSRFPERIHLDMGWTVTQIGGRTPVGLLGIHLTLLEVGRVAFYGPPGFLLVLWPDESGDRTLKPAYSWGVSIRLKEFGVPSTEQRAILHLNVSKVWVTGIANAGSSSTTGLDMAGLSLSWKRR